MNQNWSKSSFPKPLNKRNFTVFSILNHDGDGGGTGEVFGDGGEDGGGVGRGGICGNPYLINCTPLCDKTFDIASSSTHGGEIRGLYSRPLFRLFL